MPRTSLLQPSASSHTRYALLLALGEYPLGEIPESERDPLIQQLGDWYQHDPSSAVHGATGWLLRQWGQDEFVQRVDQTPMPYSTDREWFTLVITVKSPRSARPGEAELSGQFLKYLSKFCHNWQVAYSTEVIVDGTGPTSSRLGARTHRGGSWGYVAANSRSSARLNINPFLRVNTHGLRLALVPSSMDAERQESSDSPPAEARRERSGAATEGAVADDDSGMNTPRSSNVTGD